MHHQIRTCVPIHALKEFLKIDKAALCIPNWNTRLFLYMPSIRAVGSLTHDEDNVCDCWCPLKNEPFIKNNICYWDVIYISWCPWKGYSEEIRASIHRSFAAVWANLRWATESSNSSTFPTNKAASSNWTWNWITSTNSDCSWTAQRFYNSCPW